MRSLFFVLIIMTSCTIAAQNEDNRVNHVSYGDLEAWVGYLSSDLMRGRMNGSPEMAEAADWLAGKFEEFDIVPFAEYQDFFQPYRANSRRTTVDEKNVIGYIGGSDPALKDEYIILTAHFDHIGVRAAVDGDSIYNGADDNAAGTSTLLGIAKYFKDNNIKPGRSIIFAAVSGEEMGLRGSRHLAKNLPVPPWSLYANLNFEMIGHSEYLGRGNYYMTGTGQSNLDDLINKYIQGSDIHLVDTIQIASRLFYMSDNAAFARMDVNDGVNIGIPCGTFATTTFAEHIHSPIDEAALFDFENMALLVNHFAEVVAYLSKSSDRVVWTDPLFTRPVK